MTQSNAQSQGIYIHIPFCRAKCGYCDFNSYAGMEDAMASYTEAVCTEITTSCGGTADTLYFGGGTPTLLPLPHMQQLLDAVSKHFSLAGDAEITLEANPATFDRDQAAAYRAMGFNRISIGVQSFSPLLLRRLGRLHDDKQAIFAVESASAAGFTNISIDLMYALPGQTPQQLEQDLRRVQSLPISHLSVYGLKIEEGTPFARQNITVQEDDYVQMYEEICTLLPEMGFAQYELSNFAHSGAKSRHNLKYWRHVPYLGLGAGAHSFDGQRRWKNRRSIADYIAAADKRVAVESLTEQDHLVEKWILGMRLTEGVPEQLPMQFPGGAAKLRQYANAGFLFYPNPHRIAFTTKGFLVSNTILSSFLP